MLTFTKNKMALRPFIYVRTDYRCPPPPQKKNNKEKQLKKNLGKYESKNPDNFGVNLQVAKTKTDN